MQPNKERVTWKRNGVTKLLVFLLKTVPLKRLSLAENPTKSAVCGKSEDFLMNFNFSTYKPDTMAQNQVGIYYNMICIQFLSKCCKLYT